MREKLHGYMVAVARYGLRRAEKFCKPAPITAATARAYRAILEANGICPVTIPKNSGEHEPGKTYQPLSCPDILKVKDCADIFQICTKQAWNLVKRGEIECFRIGTSIRIPRECLEAYITRQRRESRLRNNKNRCAPNTAHSPT